MPSYYRSDVPKKSPYRNVIALVVVLVVGLAVYMGVRVLWGFAQARSVEGDAELIAAVSGSSEAADPYFPWQESDPTSDDVENILLLTVDDVSFAQPRLSDVEVLTLNATQHTALVAHLPSGMWVAKEDGSDVALDVLFGESGAANVAGARCGLRVSNALHLRFHHIIVMNEGMWQRMRNLAGGGTPFVTQAAELLPQMKTDLNADGLLGLIERGHDCGMANPSTFDAEAYDWPDAAGTVWKWVSPEPLGRSLGTLVPRAASVPEAPAEGGAYVPVSDEAPAA